MMHDHFQLSDLEFETQFRQCSLNPHLFNHEAHLRLAWIHINNYGLNKAIENFCDQLVSFVNHFGANDKFNKTLTVAAVKIVYHFMQKENLENFKDFIENHPRLKNNFKQLIDTHYSINIFANEAKQEFIEPDLLPFT